MCEEINTLCYFGVELSSWIRIRVHTNRLGQPTLSATWSSSCFVRQLNSWIRSITRYNFLQSQSSVHYIMQNNICLCVICCLDNDCVIETCWAELDHKFMSVLSRWLLQVPYICKVRITTIWRCCTVFETDVISGTEC